MKTTKQFIFSGMAGLLLFGLAVPTSFAGSVTLLNTGAPDMTGASLLLDSSHWVATEFTVNQTVDIGSVSGFIQLAADYGAIGQTFTVAIYGNQAAGGNRPAYDTNADNNGALYLQQASVSTDNGWNGLTGLGNNPIPWQLVSGVYWVAFEVQASDSLAGLLPTTTLTHADRAANDMTANFGYLPISTSSANDFGVNITTVPEPAAWVFFMAAFAVLLGSVKARKGMLPPSIRNT